MIDNCNSVIEIQVDKATSDHELRITLRSSWMEYLNCILVEMHSALAFFLAEAQQENQSPTEQIKIAKQKLASTTNNIIHLN